MYLGDFFLKKHFGHRLLTFLVKFMRWDVIGEPQLIIRSYQGGIVFQ